MVFNLEKFELLVVQRNIEEAGKCFYDLLELLCVKNNTSISELIYSSIDVHSQAPHLLTRLCASIGQLITLDEFQLSIPNYDVLMQWQVVISKLYYLTPFINTDHLLEQLIQKNENGIVSGNKTIKLFFLFSTESNFQSRVQFLFNQNQELYLTTCLMLIWGCSGSAQSCSNREWAYEQIPTLTNENNNLTLPLALIHFYFMHSSYGFSENKHFLKSAINKTLRNQLPPFHSRLNNYSLSDSHRKLLNAENTARPIKKVLLVILEFFNEMHSVYRVLGKSLLACKDHYTLVAVAWPGYVNIPDDFFDYTLTLSGNGVNYSLDELYGIVNHFKPAAVYYPSLGMAHWSIYYSNIRLAPVQFAAIGHGASSFATEIDYFLIEEDIAGESHTYSEKLIKLPAGSMPFYYPKGATYKPKTDDRSKEQSALNIVCSASFMKINAKFLEMCKRIRHLYQQKLPKLNFTFFIQMASEGISSDGYRQLISQYLPDAKVYVGLPLQAYIDLLAEMDLSLSTYPYSGMNTVVDYAMLGIPGVRMDGPEVHEAIEAGMWRRMGMPEWLIANNEMEYEAAICRLIDNPHERLSIRQTLLDEQRWKVFFEGDANIFAQTVDQLISAEA